MRCLLILLLALQIRGVVLQVLLPEFSDAEVEDDIVFGPVMDSEWVARVKRVEEAVRAVPGPSYDDFLPIDGDAWMDSVLLDMAKEQAGPEEAPASLAPFVPYVDAAPRPGDQIPVVAPPGDGTPEMVTVGAAEEPS